MDGLVVPCVNFAVLGYVPHICIYDMASMTCLMGLIVFPADHARFLDVKRFDGVLSTSGPVSFLTEINTT